ncbi:MAG TPA: DNA topoisomerase, partial [Candidatus Sulfotelmatobacter sp.]|nr:DNA topoisomerase [Candidatus Sulfotelmatobacter sp.]
MATPLIIVESPSKARTLSRFLGPSYVVKASMGHVRDLPKSKMGVDVEKGFVPEYEVIKGKEQQIRELRSASKKADATLLAADPDREGEAIAWHIAEALKLRDPDRVVFHEITQRAVEAALASPRKIDRALVAAQEARRVIDRLVGYRLSPLLWKKVRTGLSAGRVQSVAVRLVVDRENEILAFVPRESWSIDALLSKEGAQFKARLIGERGQANAQAGTGSTPRKRGNAGVKGAAGGNGANPAAAGPAEAERLEVGKEDQARAIAQALGFNEQGRPGRSTPPFRVTSIETSESSRSAPFPYTTSTLQQDASTRLRFSPRRTMVLAQQLYEGLEVGHEGPVGLITYMRTDSTRISDTARADAADYIKG